MSKPKLIAINISTSKEIARFLGRAEKALCVGCEGELHDVACPARTALQQRNYLTQRINNPNKRYGI